MLTLFHHQIFAILSGIGAFMCYFICPETKFARPAFAIDGQLTRIDEYGNMVVLSDEDAKEIGADQGEGRLRASAEPFTYVQSLSLMAPIDKNSIRVGLTSYYQMARALLNPAIIWALGAASIILSVTIAQSLSFGSILGHDYHWKPENIGLIYLGTLPGAAAAFFICGWGGDKLNLWLAKRNGGVHLPEHRVSPDVLGCGVTSDSCLL
jgi:hypothetical protein